MKTVTSRFLLVSVINYLPVPTQGYFTINVFDRHPLSSGHPEIKRLRTRSVIPMLKSSLTEIYKSRSTSFVYECKVTKLTIKYFSPSSFKIGFFPLHVRFVKKEFVGPTFHRIVSRSTIKELINLRVFF